MWWLPLVLFLALGISATAASEWRERRKARKAAQGEMPVVKEDASCCGAHLVCERDTLLASGGEAVYYDDEELDALSGIEPEDLTEAQRDALREVFDSLREEDVAGWCRSLQLRNISLPQDLREEALFIVRERRSNPSNTDTANRLSSPAQSVSPVPKESVSGSRPRI